MSRHAFISLAFIGAGLALTSPSASAQPLTPGNLVIYRVGTGSAPLGSAATAVFLDEYTASGALVQSIALPSSGTTVMTAVGNATTEGIISATTDRSTILFTGYRKDAGGTNPSSDTPTATNRIIGRMDITGIPNLSQALNDTTGTIRSATLGPNGYYLATSTSVRYLATPAVPVASTVSIDARNSRQVLLGSDNTLYASNGSTTITGKVQHYGVLPTGTTAATPVVTLGLSDAVNGFVVLDVDPGVPGDDTIYALSTVESRLRKYTFDGVNWNANGFISTSAQNVTANVVDTRVNLFLTSGSTLSWVNDTSGFAGDLTGTPINPLATAGTNTAFRGVVIFNPVPEPSLLIAAAGIALAVIRPLSRRRASLK